MIKLMRVFIVAAAALASGLDVAGGELLYNGIRLPEVWPPGDFRPLSNEPMPVPYLEHPPSVIPIQVGRQLFVDDFLVEHTDLRRTHHAARRFEGNPVFTPQTEQEIRLRSVVYLGHGGVFYDPQDQLFKMFYTAGWRGPLSLATSGDMIEWTRPELSPERGNVLKDGRVDDNSVWLDIHAKNPDQRVKYLEADRKRGHMLYTSPDGLQWSEGVNTGRYRDDYTSFFYNPFRNVWVYSIRDRDKLIQEDKRGRRARYYQESPDFLNTNWDDAVYWTCVDWLDRPEPVGSYHPAAHGHGCQLYSLNAVAYESLIVGMHYIHRGPVNQICEENGFPKLTDLEVGFTRDGFHWHRPRREPFIAATRRDGDWDRAYLHSTTGIFVVIGDQLVFPYTAYSGHAPDGSQGIYHGGSVGLATLRRDGFASLDAGPGGGTLTTRPVVFDGRRLFVNADIPEGALTVEILDEDGQTIEPYTLDHCVPFVGDSTLAPITWNDGADLSALRQTPVRFRFRLTGGSLYAFWVSKDQTGRSDGYLGAGGPGYEDVVDTVGKAALEGERVDVFRRRGSTLRE